MENFNPNEFNPYENPENKHSDHFSPYGHPPIRMIKPANTFETAAWILAIASILSCLTFYGAYIFGALAILFALLSRGGQMMLSQKSKRSLLLGITAIVLTTVIFVAAFYIMLEEFGSIEGIVREYCRLTGYDFETYFGDMFTQ